jgi:hypothetical protein
MASMDIVERVQRLLRRPAVEWEVIDAEPHTVPELFTRYVMPLAAIPPVCAFLGYSVIGISNARLPLSYGVTHFVLSYGLSIFSVYVLALAIDGLAQPFGGRKNFVQAMKVSAFAPTAAWLAGAFSLVPWVSILSLAGAVYSLYLLYLALPRLMKVPEQQALGYTTVVMLVALVVTVAATALPYLAIPPSMRGF